MKKSSDRTDSAEARRASRAKTKPLPFRYGDEQGGFLVDAEEEHTVAPGGTPDADADDRPATKDHMKRPVNRSKL